MVRLLAFLLLVSLLPYAHAAAPRTFAEAKKAAWAIYASGNRVDLDSCGYVPRKNRQRAERIEWEHIVPAWVIGHQRQCWQNGGRANCAKKDATYRRAEADLHNLVPSIGEINGDRSNYGFAWLPQKPTQYGSCPMVVDFKARKAMPRQPIRGMIARTYFYMADRYKLRL
jgi:deoxyribonuclease-1